MDKPPRSPLFWIAPVSGAVIGTCVALAPSIAFFFMAPRAYFDGQSGMCCMHVPIGTVVGAILGARMITGGDVRLARQLVLVALMSLALTVGALVWLEVYAHSTRP